jgi:hypothetical protein
VVDAAVDAALDTVGLGPAWPREPVAPPARAGPEASVPHADRVARRVPKAVTATVIRRTLWIHTRPSWHHVTAHCAIFRTFG